MTEPDGGDTNHGINAQGWVMIIGALFIGITQVLQMVLTYNRENVRQEDVKVVAAKVEEVATKQTEAVAEVKTAIDTKAQEHQDKLKEVIQEVKKVESK